MSRKSLAEKKVTRKFLICLLATLALATVSHAEAQQPRRIARIGYLENGTASGSAELLDAFRKQMAQLDWIEGKNLTIEYRYADGNRDQLSELALQLVKLKPDAIVGNNTETSLALKKATSTIP